MKEPFKPAEKQNRLLQDKARKKKMQEGPVFLLFLLFVFAGGNVRGATFEMGE